MAELALSHPAYSGAVEGAHAVRILATCVRGREDLDGAIAAIDERRALAAAEPSAAGVEGLALDREMLVAVRDLARIGPEAPS